MTQEPVPPAPVPPAPMSRERMAQLSWQLPLYGLAGSVLGSTLPGPAAAAARARDMAGLALAARGP